MKKNKMAAWGLVGMMATLTACNNTLSGTMNAALSFQLNDKNGKAIDVAVGDQSVSVVVNSGNIQIKLADIAGKNQTAQINLPKGTKIPTTDGSFAIPASESGQSVDVQGSVATSTSEGAEESQFQSCTWYSTETICQTVQVPGPTAGTTVSQQQCNQTQIANSGQQFVQFHDETTTLSGTLTLTNPATGAEVAQFIGENVSDQTVNDNVGACVP